MDFERLKEKLFETKQEWNNRVGKYFDILYPRRGVKMSKGEWLDLVNLIKGPPRIPVTIENVLFGFNIGLVLWTLRQEPYPGAVISSERIMVIYPEQHPEYLELKNRLPLYYPDGSEDEGKMTSWDVFSELANDPDNLKALEENKLPKPGTRASYAY